MGGGGEAQEAREIQQYDYPKEGGTVELFRTGVYTRVLRPSG